MRGPQRACHSHTKQHDVTLPHTHVPLVIPTQSHSRFTTQRGGIIHVVLHVVPVWGNVSDLKSYVAGEWSHGAVLDREWRIRWIFNLLFIIWHFCLKPFFIFYFFTLASKFTKSKHISELMFLCVNLFWVEGFRHLFAFSLSARLGLIRLSLSITGKTLGEIYQ